MSANSMRVKMDLKTMMSKAQLRSHHGGEL